MTKKQQAMKKHRLGDGYENVRVYMISHYGGSFKPALEQAKIPGGPFWCRVILISAPGWQNMALSTRRWNWTLGGGQPADLQNIAREALSSVYDMSGLDTKKMQEVEARKRLKVFRAETINFLYQTFPELELQTTR
ncbi:hypothetical protein [Desulfurivibrio sp. C05AmB]|uniref:hypothetical protein n=1 Tax=Desulfurivibrio sp. C05AmB TaxID=3374371 RepID=UPI00376ED407